MQQFDVVVLGAGMVGAATALGFARKGLNVAVVEPFMPAAFNAEQAPDLRVSAISMASENLLRSLGAWQHIQGMRAHPYRRLAVWEEEGNLTEFDAKACGHDHMGYMVENRIIQLGIHHELKALENVQWFAAYTSLNSDTGEIILDGVAAKCALIVDAEGANSPARIAAGIATEGWQYKQSVLSITVKCKYQDYVRAAPHEQGSPLASDENDTNITWQRFVPGGPKAFLPLFDNHAALIWYDQNATIKQLNALSPSELKQSIVKAFPDRLPEFDIIETASFPLTRMHAKQYFRGKMVLVGDAAHTINPLAGQGVNLGFKDVAALLDCVSNVSEPHALADMLMAYQKQRKPQNLLMMSAMDAIYHVFQTESGPLKLMRNIGLDFANRMPWAKDKVMRYAMGLD